jgi:hypothetical protein
MSIYPKPFSADPSKTWAGAYTLIVCSREVDLHHIVGNTMESDGERKRRIKKGNRGQNGSLLGRCSTTGAMP